MNYLDKAKPNEFIDAQDLPRTFSQQRWFREDPQSMMLLERTLGAYSVLEMKDGYCQSLNFIAGMLLITNEYQPVSFKMISH